MVIITKGLSFFLSWVSKTQPKYWSKVRSVFFESRSRNCFFFWKPNFCFKKIPLRLFPANFFFWHTQRDKAVVNVRA